MSPHVVLATNRGLTTIRGSDGITSPHGVPVDLLDRCMIVRTMPYSRDEIRDVLRLRARVEGLTIAPDALEKLADNGTKTSLRYALQLLTPASILAKLGGRSGEITLADVSETDELFLDARGSARMLQQQQQGL